MKTLEKDQMPTVTGIVKGFTPNCATCRAASFLLGKLEKKFPEQEFYEIDLTDQEAAQWMGSNSLPVIQVYENGNRIFSSEGAGAVKQLESFLTGEKQ